MVMVEPERGKRSQSSFYVKLETPSPNTGGGLDTSAAPSAVLGSLPEKIDSPSHPPFQDDPLFNNADDHQGQLQ